MILAIDLIIDLDLKKFIINLFCSTDSSDVNERSKPLKESVIHIELC